MSPLTLRTDFGCTEAVIDEDCGLKRFYEVANILSDDLDIKFTQKTDDFDSLMLDFHYSDWWADPQKQNKPAAWKNLDFLCRESSCRPRGWCM